MNDLPEAPASTNTRIQTPNGFQWQITMRTETVKELVEQIKKMEALFATNEWKVPEWQQENKGGYEKKDPTTINFGKHKGTKWKDLEVDYLKWLVENAKYPQIKKKAEDALKSKDEADPTESW